jgi:hypothetical protein
VTTAFEIASERIDRKSEEAGGLYYAYVRIYLKEVLRRDADITLDDVDYVIYKLDESYGDSRLQQSRSRATNFEIKIWTYGWFYVTATVITKDGRAADLGGKVEYEPTDQEVAANGRKQFTW